jgi:hypothetical protein
MRIIIKQTLRDTSGHELRAPARPRWALVHVASLRVPVLVVIGASVHALIDQRREDREREAAEKGRGS